MMLKLTAVLLLSLFLTACGTSSQVRSDYARAADDRFTYDVVNTGGMSEEALGIFQERLTAALQERGQLAESNGSDARTIRVEITNYRMRHGSARALVGIMAGRDSIRSDVRILDAGGTVLGEIEIDSGNSTAWGTSRGLIQGHAQEIVDFATGGAGG